MPNWCQNVVTFSHNDPTEIRRLETAFANGRMMAEFHPCPQELLTAVSPAATADIAEANINQHGSPDWYSWCVTNWGTKWDVGEAVGINTVDDDSMVVYFDSAWSPPLEFYQHMCNNGWSIEANYYEPGVGFCGTWLNGENDQYDLTDMSADDAEAELPVDLNETFQISENMRMHEEDEDGPEEDSSEEE